MSLKVSVFVRLLLHFYILESIKNPRISSKKFSDYNMERVDRIEPSSSAWKAEVMSIIRYPRKWWGESV